MTPTADNRAFLEALAASNRSADLADADDLFDFLVGSWDLAARLHDEKGNVQSSQGELLVAWILEGRALQDLFIFPTRADRRLGRPSRGDRYGSTIRV